MNNSTDTETSPPFVGQHVSNAARAVFATYGSVIILCGVMGNVLLVTVLVRRFRQKRHVHDLFLANLALANMLSLGYWVIFLVLDLILGFYPAVNHAHCVVNGIVIYTLCQVCIWSLLGISLNRYLHVCHSQLCKRLFTLSRAVSFIIAIWVVSILLALLPVFNIGAGEFHFSVHFHICSFNRESWNYAKVMFILFTSGPMMFTGVCNFAIFRFWRKSQATLNNWKDHSRLRKLLTWRKGRSGTNPEIVASAGQGTGTDTGKCPGETTKLGCVQDGEGGGRGICVNAFQDLNGSEYRDSQSQSSACNTDGPGDHTESFSRTINSPPHKREVSNASCSKTITSTTSDEVDPQSKIAVRPDHDADEESVDRCEIKPMSDNVSVTPENLSSEDEANMTEEASVTVTSAQPIAVLNCSRLHQSAESAGKTSSTRNPSELPPAAKSKLHQQRKKPSAREVAFVRSLFAIFLTTCLTFGPYVIIIIVSSFIAVSSEVAILGLLLLFSNNALNWLVYGVMNPSFREAYRECGRQLMGWCCQGQRVLPAPEAAEEMLSGKTGTDIYQK